MKKSSVWLGIFVGSLICIAAVACCTFSGTTGDSGNVYASEAEVDLEQLSKAYKQHLQRGNRDLAGFEKTVNKPHIYYGDGYVRTRFDDQGRVIGYVDKNKKNGYQKAGDKLIFAIQADKKKKRIVARDRHHRHYGLNAGDVFSMYLISRMLDRQHRYYGGRYWRPPARANWVRSGYHKRIRSSGSRGSGRSVRSGSRGSRRSGSGGFGFGK